MWRFTLVVAVLVVLPGCLETQAVKRTNQLNALDERVTKDYDVCIDGVVAANPEAIKMMRELGLGSDSSTIEKRLNRNFLSQSQKQLLMKVIDAREKCVRASLTAMRSLGFVHPAYVALQAFVTDATVLWLELLRDEVTVGEASGRITELDREYQINVQRGYADYNAAAQASHGAELAERERAYQRAMDDYARQQAIDAMNRPTQTNCNAVGNTVNCTTW